MIKFVMTDGRPWYKQAVSGLFLVLSLLLNLFSFTIFIGGLGLIVMSLYYIGIVKVLAGLCIGAALFGILIGSIVLYEWANE